MIVDRGECHLRNQIDLDQMVGVVIVVDGVRPLTMGYLSSDLVRDSQ